MPDCVLVLKIEVGRIHLNKIIDRYGRESKRAVRYSQKLDKLIVELQARKVPA